MQVSRFPKTPKLTPDIYKSSATAFVVFLARSSYAPAQPTQNKYSISSGITESITVTGKSTSLIQASRSVLFAPHGLPAFSKLRNVLPSSVGNSDSTKT